MCTLRYVSVCVVPPSIQVSDRVAVVTERGTAELPCVADGFPQPRISWIKDGRLSLDSGGDSRYQLHPSGSLTITDVQVGRAALLAILLSKKVNKH